MNLGSVDIKTNLKSETTLRMLSIFFDICHKLFKISKNVFYKSFMIIIFLFNYANSLRK